MGYIVPFMSNRLAERVRVHAVDLDGGPTDTAPAPAGQRTKPPGAHPWSRADARGPGGPAPEHEARVGGGTAAGPRRPSGRGSVRRVAQR